MDARRFDSMTRSLADRSSRRAVVAGGLAAVAAGLGSTRARRRGRAQDAATPAASPVASPLASPVASPGPLDLLAGTPAAGGEVLGRGGGTCDSRRQGCSSYQDWNRGGSPTDAPLSYASWACCSGTCRFWRLPDWQNPHGDIVSPGWYCD